MTAAPLPARDNALLSALPKASLDALRPHLELEQVRHKQSIYERGKPISHVYFPCDCVFSVLAFMANGMAVEVGTIGYEGFVGIEGMLGSDIALDACLCQVEGGSMRMPLQDFKDAVAADPALRQLAQLYLQCYLSQVFQSVACNRLHTVEERFARWVLLTHDRSRRDNFYLTQEFIADMLGTQRPTVSLIAGAFQQAGMIRYSRGNLTILNRAGLEQSSCECYHSVKHRTHHLLGMARG